MSEYYDRLLATARSVLAMRKANMEGLSLDYLEGFREGLAEMIAAECKLAAADVLEELD